MTVYRSSPDATAYTHKIREATSQQVLEFYRKQLDELLTFSRNVELQFQFEYGEGYFERFHVEFFPAWAIPTNPPLKKIFRISLAEEELEESRATPPSTGPGNLCTGRLDYPLTCLNHHWEYCYPEGGKRIPTSLDTNLYLELITASDSSFNKKLSDRHSACIKADRWQKDKDFMLHALLAIAIFAAFYFGVRSLRRG